MESATCIRLVASRSRNGDTALAVDSNRIFPCVKSDPSILTLFKVLQLQLYHA